MAVGALRWRDARAFVCTLVLSAFGLPTAVLAQETVCARVKIEIKQELTLERQAFEAEMKINNTTDTSVIENVLVNVKVADENGTPVPVSSDPNDLSAKFFIRVSNKENISDVDGTGSVDPQTTATITWLLIPAPGAASGSPLGKKYLVGATLRYRYGGEDSTLDVYPDVITVKPLPLLSLDYFLTQYVNADDPLTPEIEPVEPFTLGVRVKNNGLATAEDLKIDSAQPKIVENNQGLLINFLLTGSYVNDAPVQNTLLVDFGDLPANTAKMGRWIMETSLSGEFTEFTAKLSHADELGGTLTSIVEAANAHFLIRDVRVDLPGRDLVRDFLAQDGDVIRVYESDGPDTEVTDRSAVASLTAGTGTNGNASYHLSIPPTDGFVYVKLPDPYQGQKALGQVMRADAKAMLAENVWLSKTRNEQTKQWEYWVNFFDVNTPGEYDAEFQAPPPAAQPPVLQFIPDYTIDEGEVLSFIVEASSPDGGSINLSAAPLPTGAQFQQQAVDPQSPNVYRASFEWTPASGQAGNYPISFTASDGQLSATRVAQIKVNVPPPPIPGEPTIERPGLDAQVTSLTPTLVVRTSDVLRDRTAQVQFEVYADEAMTQRSASGLVDKGQTTGDMGTTSFTVLADLIDNHHYWWRVRAFDGDSIYSPWVNGRFFVNTYNDPPDTFNLTAPAAGIEVDSLTPQLSWTNSLDKDEDPLVYGVFVYSDSALTQLVTSAENLVPSDSGTTSWTVDVPLTNHQTYYWKASATDTHGAQTVTIVRAFIVNTGNTTPSVPVIVSPADGGQTTTPTTVLTIETGTDAENDLITYVFEIDTVSTFDSGDKQSSGQIIQGAGATTSWNVGNLVENKKYWWRVKAQDGRAETAWVGASFRMNATNNAPPTPTVKNPGDGAWSATVQPTLEANAVVDPEEENVRYEFEIYRGANLDTLVTSGISDTTAWTVPAPLDDKTTHSWRVRAVDEHNAASAWSAKAVLYVSSGTYQNPSIQLLTPSEPTVPHESGGQKTVTIRWEGNDPNIESTAALYYASDRTNYAGTLIADHFHHVAGSYTDEYVWDVANLPVGTYYVYGVIYDAMGYGKAYAAGAVVIPPASPSGSVVVSAGSNLKTSEGGQSVSFSVALGSAPRAEVIVPIVSSNPHEGVPAASQLVFTPENWQSAQAVTVTGVNDCINDGAQAYQVLVGSAVSTDPNYIGLSGSPVSITNNDDAELNGSTNNASLLICSYEVVSYTQVNLLTREYVVTAELTNTGAPISGANATLTRVPLGVSIVEDNLQFGAVNTSETVKSVDTFTIRSNLTVVSDLLLVLSLGMHWDVAPQ